MFEKLFGATEEDQMRYLEKKVFALGIAAVLSIIAFVLMIIGLDKIGGIVGSVSGAIFMVVLFMFGFGAIKSIMGWGSIGAIFSGNIVIGVVILVFCAIAAYLVSLFVALLAVGRYIYLKVKSSTERG